MRTIHIETSNLPNTVQSALSQLGYRKKDISITARETESLLCGGGNGYRCFVAVVNLSTGHKEITYGSWGGSNMFNPNNAVDLDDTNYTLPADGLVIKGQEGGSSPVSASITVNPQAMPKYLPAGDVGLTDRQQGVLYAYMCLISSARKEYVRRAGSASVDQLIDMGLLKQRKNGAMRITIAGKNACNRS